MEKLRRWVAAEIRDVRAAWEALHGED